MCLFSFLLSVVGDLIIFPLLRRFQLILVQFNTLNVSKRNSLNCVNSGKLQLSLCFTEFHSPSYPGRLSSPTSCVDRYGLIHQARISASVNAMRVLNTGTEVEAAVADALVGCCIFLFLLCITQPIRKPVAGVTSRYVLIRLFYKTVNPVSHITGALLTGTFCWSDTGFPQFQIIHTKHLDFFILSIKSVKLLIEIKTDYFSPRSSIVQKCSQKNSDTWASISYWEEQWIPTQSGAGLSCHLITSWLYSVTL